MIEVKRRRICAQALVDTHRKQVKLVGVTPRSNDQAKPIKHPSFDESFGKPLAGINRFLTIGKGVYGDRTHFEMSSLLVCLSAACHTASVTAFMHLAASEVTVKPKSFRHSCFLLIGKWWKTLKAMHHLTNCQINLCSLLRKMGQSFLSFLDVRFFE